MSGIDGLWDTVVQSPIGVQKTVMTLSSAADGSFSGVSKGPMGDAEISDGAVVGQVVTFAMKVTKPIPMTLNTTATLTENNLEGEVDTGAFGKMAMTATRQA